MLKDEERERELEEELADVDEGESRIRCPKCRWEPRQDSLWSCTCWHTWNTFDTAGLCPGCGKQWEDTVCLSCHRWSKHRDWYSRDEP